MERIRVMRQEGCVSFLELFEHAGMFSFSCHGLTQWLPIQDDPKDHGFTRFKPQILGFSMYFVPSS